MTLHLQHCALACGVRYRTIVGALVMCMLACVSRLVAQPTSGNGIVSIGPHHGVALKSDGTVWMWGRTDVTPNTAGQPGAGIGITVVGGIANAVSVSAGSWTSLAAKSDGTVWMWGFDTATWKPVTTPRQVNGLGGIVRVLAARNFSVALKSDGTVWGWGDNYYGQLGDGTAQSSRFTPAAAIGVSGVSAIAVGSEFTVALKSDGTVWTWGINFSGQLGRFGGVSDYQPVPAQVAGLTGVIGIAAGEAHTMALTSDGRVWTWGRDGEGQLGNGNGWWRNTPQAIASLTGVVQIVAGKNHSLALKSDGTVWAWGKGSAAQLGDGAKVQRNMPVQVSGIANATAIIAGADSSGALLGDGSLWTWGDNLSSQLGYPSATYWTKPVQPGAFTDVVAVAAGSQSTIAVKNDGTVWTAGANWTGQLGDGTTVDRATPGQVAGLAGVTQVAAGAYSSYAVKNDGTVYAWGGNAWGQLGDGTTTTRLEPVRTGGASFAGVVRVSIGLDHAISLKSDGTLWGWGGNGNGQLGDGTQEMRTAPVQARMWYGPALPSITSVSAGQSYTVALRNTGMSYGWGSMGQGRLGVDEPENPPYFYTLAHEIQGLSGAVALVAGAQHTLALMNDGTVRAFGGNYWGQLGDGTTTMRSQPQPVAGLSGVTQVATYLGGGYALARKSDGSVWGWGDNGAGQLGDGTTTQRHTPVRVFGISNAVAISAGGSHAVALLGDGTLRAWGSFYYAPPGFDRLRPMRVGIRLAPSASDLDGDSLDDDWETQFFGDLNRTGTTDTDGDGLTDFHEFVRGTDPTQQDADGDRLTDFADTHPSDPFNGVPPTLVILGGNHQIAVAGQFNAAPFDVAVWDPTGTAPVPNTAVTFSVSQGGGLLAANSSGTALNSTLIRTTDGDGTAQSYYRHPSSPYTLSQVRVSAGTAETSFSTLSTAAGDLDGNGLRDTWENEYFGQTGVNPLLDPDGDGLNNGQESLRGTNPLAADTDGDGVSDAQEIADGRDPLELADGASLPANVQIVIKLPGNEYKGVKPDWSIVPIAAP